MLFGVLSVLIIIVGSACFAALAVGMDNLGDKIVASISDDKD